MADDIVQIIENARVDATSLSEFIYYPANVMVQRRLAPSIHTLNYYLDYLHGLELIYSQPTGTVTVNGEEVKTVRQAVNDSVDSILIGEYQTALEGRVSTNEINITTNSASISTLDTDLNTVKNTVDSLGVIEGKLPSSSVSISDGRTQEDLNSEVIVELAKPKTDASIEVTQKLGSLPQTLKDFNKYSPLVTQFVTDNDIDMTEGLRAYHNYCNLFNIPASYSGLSSIKIQADAQIIVNTSFDLCGAKVYLLNGLSETPTWNNQKVTYIVYDNQTPEVSVTGAIDVLGRTAQSLYPTLGLFSGKGYALLTDPDVWIPNRAATGTVSYTQSFHVIRDGQATQPLSRSIVGTNCTVLYRKDSPRGSLVVKNINLVADGNWNHQTLFSVQRNSVSLVNFTLEHIANPTTSNISSLVMVTHCSNFVFSGVSCKGVEYTSSGTYVLNIDGCVDLLLDRIYTATGWGWIGTNNINGMYVQNSSVLRIDGHNSLHNVFVSKTSFHGIGISCGWGGGVVMMSDITLHGSSAFYGRNDYGSYFLGDIVISGVRMLESADNRAIVNMAQTGGVGVITRFANNISISNVTLAETTDPLKRLYALIKLKVSSNGSTVVPPSSIHISNVTSSSDNSAEISIDYGGSRSSGQHGLNIENVRVRELQLNIISSNTINHTANPVILNAVLTNINNNVGCNIDSPHPISTLVISNVRRLSTLSVPANVKYGISSAINIYDSFIAPSSSSVIGNTSTGSSHYTRIYSSEVTNNGNLSGTDALQGCIVGTTTTLPATVTPLKAFTGWKNGLTA